MANQIPPIPQRTQGMDPTAELQQWAQWRQAVDAGKLTDQLTGDAARYYNGPSPRPGNAQFDQMYGTDLFSPEAGQTYVNAKTHFDINSGKVTKNQAGWDLPETKLIVALAAGMAGGIAAPAIAGAFGGSAGAGGAGGAAAAEAGIPTTMGIADATALGLPVTTGLGTAGLAAGAIPTAAGLTGAEFGGDAATAALPSSADLSGMVAGDVTGGFDAAGNAIGTSGGSGSTLRRASDLLGAAGEGVGNAANAAANNRGAKASLALKSQGQFETELMNRAKEEQSQRNDALKQGYYANYVQNRKPGPFNTAGITPYGADTLSTVNALAAQSKAKLANAPQYDTNGMPKIPDAQKFTDEYGNPTTMEKVGNWLSPTLTTIGKVSRYF